MCQKLDFFVTNQGTIGSLVKSCPFPGLFGIKSMGQSPRGHPVAVVLVNNIIELDQSLN